MTRTYDEIMNELRAIAERDANTEPTIKTRPTRLEFVTDELNECFTDSAAKVTQYAAINAAAQLRERAQHWQMLHGATAKSMVAAVLKRGEISAQVIELGNIQLAVIEELRFMAGVIETQPERDADWQTPGEAREAIFHAKVVAGSGKGREGFVYVDDEAEGSEPGPLCER